MALLGKRLAVSIPDTVLEEKASLRDKTAKIGAIARACSIYGVDVIEVFRDPKGAGEGGVLRKVLEYIETPQYLRRRIYPLDETLKYAGMLPPLRIPSHKPKIPLERLEIGEVREGVVVDGWNVDMGLDATARLREKAAPGRRMTVRVTSLKPLQAERVPLERAGVVGGFMVGSKSAAEVTSDPRFRVRVATSRRGTPVSEAWARMVTSIGGSPGV